MEAPERTGLFSYLKSKTGIPSFVFIILIIAGLFIFKESIFVYLFLVAVGFIILTILSQQSQTSSNSKTAAYFDDSENYNSVDLSSNYKDSNDSTFEDLQSEIHSLKSQISNLKKDYNKSIGELDNKLMNLENRLKDTIANPKPEETELSETVTASPTFSKAAHTPLTDKNVKQEEVSKTEREAALKIEDKEDIIQSGKVETTQESQIATPPPPPVAAMKKEEVVTEKEKIKKDEFYIDSLLEPTAKQEEIESNIHEEEKEDSIVFKQKKKRIPFITKVLSSLIGGIGDQISESIFGPFSAVLSKGKDLYKHYKDQGKLPVFYLTTAGTIALLLCFAYLLQYSFTNIFNEAAKMIIGFVSAGGLIVGGHILNRKKGLKEFGSVLIGAGISLNFLLIYYSSIVYSFLPPILGFGLLAVNSIAGYVLSMRYETRIAAIVSFLGGAFTPILLGAEEEFTTFYLFYLVMISAATIHVARKINWPTMAQGSVIIVTTLFQFILSKGDKVTLNLIPIHILFYLYMGYVFFREGKLQDKFSKVIALILIGNLSALLYNTYSLSSGNFQGLIFLLNAVPFILASKFLWRIMTDLVKTIVFSIVSLFILLAIPALISLDIGSYVWVIEGLLMVFLGYHLKLKAVIKEGYTLFFISLFHACWGLGSIFTIDAGLNLAKGHVISLIAIPVFTAAMAFITELFKKEFKLTDKLVNRISHTIVFYGTTISSIIISSYFVPHLTVFILLPIILAASLYGTQFNIFASKFNLKFINFIAIPIMFYFSRNNHSITTPLLWTLEILFILWGTFRLKLKDISVPQYTLFYWSLLTAIVFSTMSIDTSYLNPLLFFSLSVIPVFILNGAFIILLSKSIIKFKKSDIFVKSLSHTLIWTWISIATTVSCYFYLKEQALLIIAFSFLFSSLYANKFKVHVGKALMPALYLIGLSIGITSILNDSFLIDLSIIQFIILSFIAGLYLPLSKYLFTEHNSIEHFLTNSIKEFLIGSSILISMIISTKLNSDYQLIGIAFLVPLLLWISNKFKIKVASFYLQPALVILMIIMSGFYLTSHSSQIINSHSIGMVLIIAYVLIIDILYSKKLINETYKFTKSLILLSREMVSFVPSLFFFVITFKLLPQWFWTLSIVPMIYLLVRGSITKSTISQYGGFLVLLFPITGYFKAAIEYNSLLIIHLPLPAKIASAEIALAFWGIMHFAKRVNLHSGLVKIGRLMNTIFFVCLPLAHIPTLFDIAPSLLSVSLLSSIVISYIVARFLKQKLFYYEYMLIWIGSYIISVFQILTGSGALISPDTIALVGIIVLAIIHLIIEKSHLSEIYKVSPFKILFRVYWLSFSVVFVLAPLSVLESLEAAALGFTAWYFIICRFAHKIPAINKIAPAMFKITGWTLFPILAFSLYGVFNNTKETINLITGFLCVVGICITLYGSKQSVLNLKLPLKNYLGVSDKILQWIVHISITAFLMSLTNIFPEDYIRPAQSILLLIHAVFLTFHSYSKDYHILIRYSALLYFVFTIKVIFIDLATFSIPQKVFVFMVISLLMLGASYILQKRGMKWSIAEKDE